MHNAEVKNPPTLRIVHYLSIHAHLGAGPSWQLLTFRLAYYFRPVIRLLYNDIIAVQNRA